MRWALIVTFGLLLGDVGYVRAEAEPAPVQPQPPQPPQTVDAAPPAPAAQPYAPEPVTPSPESTNPYVPTPNAPNIYAPASVPPTTPPSPVYAPAQVQPAPYAIPPAYAPVAYPQAAPAVCTPSAPDVARYAPASSVAIESQPQNAKDQLAKKLDELHNVQEEVNRLRQVTGTPSQVLVKLQMIEISHTKLRKCGFDLTCISGDDSQVSNIGAVTAKESSKSDAIATSKALPMSFGVVKESSALLGFLDILRREQIAKVLAEPNIVTSVGRASSFNSGGEFPLPSGESKESASVQYMKFGTQVEVVPVSVGENRMRLELRFRVSEIDDSRTVTIKGVSIPGLRVREVQTGLEMALGQTMVLHGGTWQRRTAEKRADQNGSNERVRETIEDLETLILVTIEAVDAPVVATAKGSPDNEAKPSTSAAETDQPAGDSIRPTPAPARAPSGASARRSRQLMPRSPVATIARRLPAHMKDDIAKDAAVSVQLSVIDVNLTTMRKESEMDFSDNSRFDPSDDRILTSNDSEIDSRAAAQFVRELASERYGDTVARIQLKTVSAKPAESRIGGEREVVVAGEQEKVTNAFVGTELGVVPTVDAQGRITVEYKMLMSELDRDTAFIIGNQPYYRVRRSDMSGVVKLNDGQTIVAGGSIRRAAVATATVKLGKPFDTEDTAAERKFNEIQRFILLTARSVRPQCAQESESPPTGSQQQAPSETPREAKLDASPAEVHPR